MPLESERHGQEEIAVSAAEAASYKKKQILVAVLLAGLLVAILTQPKTSDVDSSLVVESRLEGHLQPSTIASPDTAPPESPQMRADRLAKIRELSRIELDEISRFELLAPEPRMVGQQRFSSTQRVQAIYGDSTDRTALVGEAIVRRGQPLSGQKVLNVTTDGVQLAR